jgi:SSS family solute:Na+ symporter
MTVLVSLVTRPRAEEELHGLVYSLTPRPSDGALPWTQRPGVLALGILGLILILNIIFY